MTRRQRLDNPDVYRHGGDNDRDHRKQSAKTLVFLRVGRDKYILDDLQHDDRTVCAGVNILPEPDPVRGRAGAVEAQGRAVAVFPPYRAIYADRHKRIPIKAKDNLHTAF